jgi:polar amino acid transport system substrate-binding protein
MTFSSHHLALLAALLFTATGATGAIGATRAPQAVALTVCSHNLPPHTFESPSGKATGLASEVLLAVAERLNWTLTITYGTWMRARHDAEQGRCDLIYTLLKKPEYEEFIAYPEQSLADRSNVLLVRKGSGIEYDGYLESFMRNHSIGLYKDKAVSPLFDQLKTQPWARVSEPMQAESVMRMLIAERFDAAIENSATAVYELRQLGLVDQVTILSPPLYVTPAYIGFSKHGQALPLMADFDREMRIFKASKEYKAMVARYESLGGQ